MATYTLISSLVVSGSTAANIDFTSIPQTYTDLLLKISIRYNGTGPNTARVQFNNNASSYSFRFLEGDATSATSGNSGATTSYMYGSYVGGTSTTASVFSNGELYIPNYAGSLTKSASTDIALSNNASQTNYMNMISNLWNNSAAITSIKITPETNSLVQYSEAFLYGIKNT